MCLVCPIIAVTAVCAAAGVKAMSKSTKPPVYRVYLGRSLWTGKPVGFVYSRTYIGIYFACLKKLWRLPHGPFYALEKVQPDGFWDLWSKRDRETRDNT